MIKRLWLPSALLAIYALARLPWLMPPNFSPVYALAFCAGAYFSGARAWWYPLALLLGTDVFLDYYYWDTGRYNPFELRALLAMAGKYAGFAAIIWTGKRFDKSSRWVALVLGGVAGALLFYLVANTFSWLTLRDYPKTWAGLWQALTTGLPGWPPAWEFFRNTLASGGLFTGLFAAAMKAREKLEDAPAAEPEEAPEAEAERGHEPEPEPAKA
jgi:hypothetical protein